MSFYGLYNDNTRYISEKLHEIRPDIEIYWLVDYKRCIISQIPEYVRKVNIKGIKRLYVENRAKILVDNIVGWYSMSTSESVYKKYINVKNKKVYNISTWHGTPIKKIGLDAYEYDKEHTHFFTTSDLLIANSNYTKRIFEKCFDNKIPVIITGTPRNDILINSDEDYKDSLRRKFGFMENERIVIYAPTYRDAESGCQHEAKFDYMWGLEVKEVLLSLERRFGGKWKMLFRGHQSDQQQEAFSNYLNEMNNLIIDGNKFPDMAEYLSVADVLITDYSGSAFDFCITQKPVFLYTPDKETYFSSNRGVYNVQLPFSYNVTNAELCYEIENFNQEKYIKEVEFFNTSIGLFEDGNASERVVNLILEKLK